MKVKSLNWEIKEYMEGRETAKTPFGNYEIIPLSPKGFVLEFVLGASCRRIPIPEGAEILQVKKIAQRDFSDKIWECIDMNFYGFTHCTYG